jgi:hypothetical protein
MNQQIQHITEALESTVAFGAAHALVPPNPRAAALYTSIGTTAAALRLHGTHQDSGNADFRSGTRTRRQAADALLGQMRPINYIARKLPSAEFPGLRDLFRMPRSSGYAAILSRASSFIDAVGPVKSTFVERGLPADFDEKLADAIDEVSSAANTRNLGRAQQVGGTTGLSSKASEGLLYLGELDSILSYLYRNDSALLGEWKSASHVQRDPERQTAGSSGRGSSSGSQPAPTTLALNGTGSGPGHTGSEVQSIAGVEPRLNGTNGMVIA